MRTLIISKIKEADFELSVNFAKRLNTEVTEAKSGKLSEVLTEPHGEAMTTKAFKKSILKAEKEPAVSHEEGQKIINQWIAELEN